MAFRMVSRLPRALPAQIFLQVVSTTAAAGLFCFHVLLATPSAAADAQLTIDAAFRFLDFQMDHLHTSITVVGERPEYDAYYPGKMGDVGALSVERATGDSQAAETGYKITYDPNLEKREGWAGVMFLYPDRNWGTRAGRNLSGATKISGWARADRRTVADFISGGINRPKKSGFSFMDSFGPLKQQIELTPDWKPFEILLTGNDLSSVIGAFGFAMSSSQGSERRSIYVRDVSIDLPSLDQPRFAQSYVPTSCSFGEAPNSAQVYDQALVLLAYLARGSPDDLRRAEIIGRALVRVQNADRVRAFQDGRLRNAYASGELFDVTTERARLPGRWDSGIQRFLEDEFAAGTDTGNMAWAGIALIQAHALLPRDATEPYKTAAIKIGRWIVAKTKVNDELGGFRGGIEGFEKSVGNPVGPQEVGWRSTEHNIDLVALFRQLANSEGKLSDRRFWLTQAKYARRFVEQMRNAQTHLWTGTEAGTACINRTVVPLDAQTWSVLGLAQPQIYESALNWALRYCRVQHAQDAFDFANTFDFNCNDGDGAWWEGTAQVAATLKVLGRGSEAAPILERLRTAQFKTGPAAGAIPSASKCGLTTGFSKRWRSTGDLKPWLYPNNPHIGATAWYIFAELGKNPYNLQNVPIGDDWGRDSLSVIVDYCGKQVH